MNQTEPKCLDLVQSQESPNRSHAVPLMGVAALASAALSACGGGADSADPQVTAGPTQVGPQAVVIDASTKALSDLDAWRFLNQATFGPTSTDLGAASVLFSSGYVSWLNEQFTKVKGASMLSLTQAYYKAWPFAVDPNSDDFEGINGIPGHNHVASAWWRKVLTEPDQLRQRMAFSLSQIVVVSARQFTQAYLPYMLSSYYDLLLDGAFGSYKDLLSKVARHPAMGNYLSHLMNTGPDGKHIPDQNFAREILQLFSIGTRKLNMDGSLQLDAKGDPIETYTPNDVVVLSHIFTGWSWAEGWDLWVRPTNHVASQTSLMKAYPEKHSLLSDFPKDSSGRVMLLGKEIKPAATPTAATMLQDMQAALDIIFSHQNVAPFIAKQMIQRLVTSNPSNGYVSRVASDFLKSGWSLRALVQSILLDTEARDATAARASLTYGKLREPLLRVTQLMRGLPIKSVGNQFRMFSTETLTNGGQYSLGQSPLMAPSVFNFFRPGFVAPNTLMGAKGLTTPEMQIGDATSTSVYVNFMQHLTLQGLGAWVDINGNAFDVNGGVRESGYSSIYMDYTPLFDIMHAPTGTLADRIVKTVDEISRRWFGGVMSDRLKAYLIRLAGKVPSDENDRSTDQWSLPNLRLAVMLAAASISSEFVVQR